MSNTKTQPILPLGLFSKQLGLFPLGLFSKQFAPTLRAATKPLAPLPRPANKATASDQRSLVASTPIR